MKKNPLVQKVLSLLVTFFLRALASSLRWSFRDESGILSRPHMTPLIFTFWHNRIMLVPYFYSRYLPLRTGTAMVSASRDGEFLSMTLKRFHINAARGSSSRKGARALLELHTAVERGEDIAITPDGPRGPCYSVQPGIAAIARQTGLPVVAMSFVSAKCWRLKSWDRFVIPKPFSKVQWVLSKPFVVEPEADDLAANEKIRTALMQITID